MNSPNPSMMPHDPTDGGRLVPPVVYALPAEPPAQPFGFSKETNELNAALSKFQAECGGVSESGKNPHFKSDYSTLSDAWKASRELLGKHGLSVLQMPVGGEEGAKIYLVTRLNHSSGQWAQSVTVSWFWHEPSILMLVRAQEGPGAR